MRALLVEQAPALFPGSRGKGIQPRTREVLDDLGVGDAVRTHGGPAPVGMVWQDGRRQGEHDMFRRAAPTEAEPYGEPWMMPQWRTQEILLARLHELGGDVAFSTVLTGLDQDAEGVTAHLSTGPVRASYLVAADGGRSTVRRALAVPMTGETVDPAPMLVADVRVAEEALDRLNWHVLMGDAGFVTLCPLPGTADFQLVAQFKEGEPDTSVEAVRALVAARTHLDVDDITEVLVVRLPPARRAGRPVPGGPRLPGGRRRPCPLPGGRAGAQHQRPGRVQPGLEARSGAAARRAGRAARQLRGGALPVAADMLGLSTRIHRGEQERGTAAQQLGLGYREGRCRPAVRARWWRATGPRTDRPETADGSSTCSGDRTSRC